MEEAILTVVVSKPRVMRDIPRLLRETRLERVDTLGFIYLDVGAGTFFPGAAETYAPMVASSGLLPLADVDRWLAEQRQATRDGTFFSACNFYAYVARRHDSEGTP